MALQNRSSWIWLCVLFSGPPGWECMLKHKICWHAPTGSCGNAVWMELAHSGYLVPLEYVNMNPFLSTLVTCTKGFLSFLLCLRGKGAQIEDAFISALLFCDWLLPACLWLWKKRRKRINFYSFWTLSSLSRYEYFDMRVSTGGQVGVMNYFVLILLPLSRCFQLWLSINI